MIYQDFIGIQITIPNTLSCIEVGDGVSMKPLHDNSYKPNLLSRYLLKGIMIFSKMETILLFSVLKYVDRQSGNTCLMTIHIKFYKILKGRKGLEDYP